MQLLFIQLLLKADNENTYFIQLACLIIGFMLTRSNSIIFCSYFIIPCLLQMLGNIKLKEKFNNNLIDNLKSFFHLIQKHYRFIGLYIILCFHAYICFIGMTKYKLKLKYVFL